MKRRPFISALLQPPHGSWVWILGPAFLAALPHFARLPVWIGICCIALWTLRLLATQRPGLMPSRTIRFALTGGCIAGVYAGFGYLLGPEPGTALLLLLLALKPFEAQGRRDQILILFTTYLVILLQFLNSQSLLGAGYMALVVLITTAGLLGIAHPASQTVPRFRIRQTATLLLQALPVMLILFLLFPRLPGSLWGMFQSPQTGVTGLSDTMRPGDISELLQSSEVAFRVTFNGQPPPVGKMYWRALVFWETDGRIWRVGTTPEESHGTAPVERTHGADKSWMIHPLTPLLEYVLTMEAHSMRWLPALEMPILPQLENGDMELPSAFLQSIPRGIEPTADFRLQLREDLRQRGQYRLFAALEVTTPSPTMRERSRALELPPSGNDRARAMARAWAESAEDQRAVVAQALDLFRGESFVYTLRPPLLGEEAMDDFLFRTRSGYCEHYTAAFTFLMRAAGIPARVVVGYQGGDRNPLGDYFVVRQYHAHAWSEVWMEETGWERVDPTTVLAPERIDVGAEALVPNIDVPRVFSSRELGWMISAWRGLTQGWDAANTLWNQWVLDFGFERQRRFLERFGLPGSSRLERFGQLALALGLSFAAAALAYALVGLRSRPTRDALDTAYARFCRRLERVGLRRAPQEGPRDFARRACAARPDLANAITAITDGYIRLRYGTFVPIEKGEKNARMQLRDLTRMVRAFRPGQSWMASEQVQVSGRHGS
ncbi:transglutaminase TgpA family protein [Desulfonatronum thioautotrophicum]|uniref:transglutaminase TgpA family protein n=1 Tax=Desulfonatronum thioautotrophicum TaxID=617001 RepID=UPI00069AB1A5|nr:DUF3488 and transglutaminase-like domain-containing protein [Desulfonatronum thioautotrophicum]